MKKNILLAILFLVFINQHSFAAKVAAESTPKITTSAELFEAIKMAPCKRCYPSIKGPLGELARFINMVTSKSHGEINNSILSIIKAYLEREGKNGENPFNPFYEDLSIYLEQMYPFDATIFDDTTCTICLNQPKNSVILSCNHIFCYDCLFEWYTRHNLKKDDTNIRCPLCKKEFNNPVLSLFISDEHYMEKSSIAMKEHERREVQEAALRILILSQLGHHS